ncbi:hypothetical protein BJX70DRAFT_409814 [Aspergillus crustosus]
MNRTRVLSRVLYLVGGIDSSKFYSQRGLDIICSSECREELKKYEKAVTNGCPNISYMNDWGTKYPISEIASSLAFEFQQTCFKQEGHYCNIVLGNLTRNGGDECDMCLLVKLRNAAQFPYGNGRDVFSTAYPSFTSSCGFSGYPISVTPTPSPSFSGTPTSSAVAISTSTCRGTEYQIQNGDTCNSVSKSQSIATFQLLLDNNLQAYCANFPKAGDLCIKRKCTTYTVKDGDSCKSVAKAHNISTVQLRSYNPWIDGGCYNFNRTIGTEICLDEPGDKYHAPSSASGSPTAPATATTSVAVPTNVADNATRNCGEYYSVKKGDDCDTIIQAYPISRENFLILNPGLNANCTNLLSGISYCVKPVGDIGSYPGASGYMPSISRIPWDSLPDATYLPMLNPIVKPLAPGTIKDCQIILDGSDLQFDFPGANNCEIVPTFWDVSIEDLLLWNPSLKDTRTKNSTECNFSRHYRYCIAKGSGSGVPSTSSPMLSPSTSVKGDNCVDFAKGHDITPEQLYEWNAMLGDSGKECGTMFQADMYYCIGLER